MTEENSFDDTKSRERIVSDIGTNFFVEAGAGSGKTTMLVNRMVAMVEAGRPINEICAITFTKAAANEFYRRFQGLLSERINPDQYKKDKAINAGSLPRPTKETGELCAKALKDIDLCFMGTIDSFCGVILSEHPSEAGISSDANLVSDEDAENFYKRQYVKICNGEYGKELMDMATDFRAVNKNAEEVFGRGASFFMNNRSADFHYAEKGKIDIDKRFDIEREKLIKVVECLAEHPELKYEGNKESIKAWDNIGKIRDSLKRKWSACFPDIVYTLNNSLANICLISEAESRKDCWPVLENMFEHKGKGRFKRFEFSEKLLQEPSELQYSVSVTFLLACVPVLENAMREKGYMTYFDYLYYLRNMLRKDAKENGGKLIEHIRKRHRYFLIDEFQDTNPLQAEIFFYLSSKNPKENWRECVPEAGTLFIVGDPKQSIYRFRNADVESFGNVKELFEKQNMLALTRNFRSGAKLCDYFNSVFKKMLLPGFEEIPKPEKTAGELQGIFTCSIDDEKKDPQKITEPMRIAEAIERLVNRDQYKIRTKDDAEPRKIKYSDIMIITSGKAKLKPIMKHLNEAGILTRVEGAVSFGKNKALRAIAGIYSAVADTNDIVALYGALTGGLIGSSNNDLLKYKEGGGILSLAKPLPDKNDCHDEDVIRVGKAMEKLKELCAKAVKLSPAAFFVTIMDDFKVYESIETNDLEVVYYALELLRDAERSGIAVTLKDGAAYLKKLCDETSDVERCLSLDDNRDAVHMANLHKVKGLEAPIVILAAASSFPSQIEKRIEYGSDRPQGYLFRLGKNNNGLKKGSYFKTEKLTDESNKEKEAGKEERKRLVYVAATRARNVLIINRIKKSPDDEKEPAKNKTQRSEWKTSVWKDLFEETLPDFFEIVKEFAAEAKINAETATAADLYKEAENTCVINKNRTAEDATYNVDNPSRLRLSSKAAGKENTNMAEGSDIDMSEEEQRQTDGVPAAVIGTMIHRLMEMLVSSKNRTDVNGAVEEIVKEYCPVGFSDGERKQLKKVLCEVAEKIRNGGYPQEKDSPDILGILLKADKVYCEVPFCYEESGEDGAPTVWSGVMDVVYRLDGEWHIVDYKTNADGGGLDDKYQNQLAVYAKAFKAITGKAAVPRIYHIDK